MLEKYYTPDQLKALDERKFHLDKEAGEKYAKAWMDIFEGLDKLRSKGIDSQDEQTKPYALKSRELLQAFTGGDKGIEKSLKNMYEQEGGSKMLKNHGLDVSEALYEYYSQTVQAHTK